MLANGFGSVSDVFINDWLASGELAVWAAPEYTAPYKQWEGFFFFWSDMPSTEPANWNSYASVYVCPHV